MFDIERGKSRERRADVQMEQVGISPLEPGIRAEEGQQRRGDEKESGKALLRVPLVAIKGYATLLFLCLMARYSLGSIRTRGA
jgi:hypothetical protein